MSTCVYDGRIESQCNMHTIKRMLPIVHFQSICILTPILHYRPLTLQNECLLEGIIWFMYIIYLAQSKIQVIRNTCSVQT